MAVINYKAVRRSLKSLRSQVGSAMVGFRASGSGSVVRTLFAKLLDLPLTFEDFGAVGDGTTDDTAAINNALTAAAAGGVGEVTCRPNTIYATSSLVTVPTGVSLNMADGLELKYTGSGTAVRVEPASPDDAGETYSSDFGQMFHGHVIRVRKSSVAWHDGASNADTVSKGIQMMNQRYSQHKLYVQGFYAGIECCGFDTDPDDATVYSTGGAHVGNIYTIYARNNFKHVLTRRNGAGGYANQNTMIGGLMRNDGSFTATGTRGFDGSDGANGWSFINVNTEGSNIEQIYRFDGLHNSIIGGRFENATAGMVKVLDGGSLSLVGGYVGTVGRELVSCDTGGTFVIIKESGSWFHNGTSSSACVTGILSGASGLFHQFRLADGKVLSESNEAGSFKLYTTAGKYDADDNPSGLTNPTLAINPATRSAALRGSTDDAAADGTATGISWATANSLSLFRATFHMENCDYNRALRMGTTLRLWSDTNGIPRIKNGTPASTSDGLSLPTLSGSAPYDPASLADGAGATTTVTATGAALGDFADASFSNDLQGITLTAWVSAADTVSVRFQNETGGVLDLASGTIRVRVAKV